MNGKTPISYSGETIIVVQGAILVYLIFSAFMLIVQAVCKPKLSNNASQRMREASKVFGIYLIGLLVCFSLQIYTIFLTLWTIEFNSEWIDRLHGQEASYTCTYSSLWIDLMYIKNQEIGSTLK